MCCFPYLSYFPDVFSRHFIVLTLVFRFQIHFEKSCMWYKVTFLKYEFSCSRSLCWILSFWIILSFYWKSEGLYQDLFLDSTWFRWYIFCTVPMSHDPDCCSFIFNLEIRHYKFSNCIVLYSRFFFLFQVFSYSLKL